MKDYTPEMKKAIYVTTLIVREMIERGEYKLFFEDGTPVKPEEYFWDESQFPIETNVNGKLVKVEKVEIYETEQT